MLNKDFLKDILAERKKLLRLDQVRRVNVPLYDELSVIKLWPMMQMDDTFMLYFPSKLSKNKVPDREYFFNVLNTFQNDYITQLIKHAHEQRNSSQAESREHQTIEITDDWWKALNAVPFVSCKY